MKLQMKEEHRAM